MIRPLACAAALGAALCARVDADSLVRLTLDGRPVDRYGGAAVLHNGHVYADAIDLTKSFDGLITLRRSGAATITIGPNTGTFSPGSTRATIDDSVVTLPAAPFVRNGDLFVPLTAFVQRIAAASVRLDVRRRSAEIRIASGHADIAR